MSTTVNVKLTVEQLDHVRAVLQRNITDAKVDLQENFDSMTQEQRTEASQWLFKSENLLKVFS